MDEAQRYFRIEAKELLAALREAMAALDADPADEEARATVARKVHTLKGAARVVGQRTIATSAREIEAILSGANDVPLSAEVVARLHEVIDALADGVDGLDASASAPRSGFAAHLAGFAPRRSPAVQATEPDRVAPVEARPVGSKTAAEPAPRGDRLDTVRVEMSELDALVESVAEARASLAALDAVGEDARRALRLLDVLERLPSEGSLPEVSRARRRLRERLHALEGLVSRHVGLATSELEEAREIAWRIRMLRVDVIFRELERVARDAADACNKVVRFRATGGRQRLDAPVLAAVREALTHVVRNAVVHGIEPPAEREARGKSATGEVTLSIEPRGDHVSISCHDDGRGLDVAGIAARAREQGLLRTQGAIDVSEAAQLALHRGLTTFGRVNDLAGHGVGLDVVRDTVARLGGTVQIESQPGSGTTFALVVPASIASVPVVEVDAGGHTAGLPLSAVRRVARVQDSELVPAAGGDRLIVDGVSMPCADLASVFGRTANGARQTIVVLAVGAEEAAVRVDRVHRVVDAVVKPLPPLAYADPVTTGVGIGSGARPCLLLDPRAVIDRLGRHPGTAPAKAEAKPATILVVDDSVTTRMLEKSILESAGYEVDLASSGEEALEKVRARSYGLLVVDVEMPGINGFELIEAIRRDPELRHLPAILVTSLARPEHRRRGLEAGAQAYIVKGEFDQDELLETVATLALDVGETS